jgi:predicted O-methyltransferase YrrM
MIDEPAQTPVRVVAAQQAAASVGFAMSCDDRTGMLLRTLAASKPGGRLLELGTGTGVGASWLIDGMGPTAHLTTVELDPDTANHARQIIGDDPRAELVVADAAQWLADYDGSPFDLAFVDCRPGKFHRRDLLLPHLSDGALYVADDLMPQPTWPADHQGRVDAFLSEIVHEPSLIVTLLGWSSGLVVAAHRGRTSTLGM